MINKQFKFKGIFEMGNSVLKQIFCKFEGQFDLEDQGQGHQFFKIGDLNMIYTQIKFKDKILNGSKVIIFTRNDIKLFDQFDHKNQGQGRHFF